MPATGVADERGTQQEQTTAATERETQAEYFMLPLGTKINKDFSNGEMVESKTMGDWRVHNGIDFAAKKGDAVKAVSAGTVLSVENDSMWGWVGDHRPWQRHEGLLLWPTKGTGCEKGRQRQNGRCDRQGRGDPGGNEG